LRREGNGPQCDGGQQAAEIFSQSSFYRFHS
jgi:hypothetical protein